MNKKRILALAIIFHITLLAAEPFMAQALIFGTGNVSGKIRSGINDFLENDLNINVKEGLKPITEGINTLDRKGKTPEVSVRFSTPNPKPGDVITASADTFGISNVNDAYYTWYLKRGDSSGEDMREMKIDAIKAQAALHFDPLTFDQPFNGGNGNGVIDGDEWPEDQDDDGFKAPMGGGNASDNNTNYCYVYDVATGQQFEISEPGDEDIATGCPEGYVPQCLYGERAVQCPVLVPSIHGGISATAEGNSESGTASSSLDVFMDGLGGSRFRNLSRCLDEGSAPRCIDGELSCLTADGDWGKNYDYDAERTLVATPYCVSRTAGDGTDCTVTVDDEEGEFIAIANGDRPHFRFSKTGTEYCGGEGETCTVEISGCSASGGTAKMTYTFINPGNPPGGGAANPGRGGRYEEGEFLWKSVADTFPALAVIIPSAFTSTTGELWKDPNTSGCPEPLYNFCFDKEGWPADETGYEILCERPFGEQRPSYYGKSCYEYYEEEYIKEPTACEIRETDDNSCDDDVRMIPEGAGDGSFTSEEEFLYNLNPLTDRTTPYAINDEALVTGLGVREFTWEYQEGDEIGVVVEGLGEAATKHEDGTFQTVFALPKPGCKDVLEGTGSYEKTVKDKIIEIATGDVDLNECVLNNNLFTKPGTAEFDALNVTVSASSGQDKTTQAATPSGLGIEKKITTTVAQVQGGNISNPHDLYYEWDVLCGGESLVGDENFTFTSKTKGTNLKNLTFIADFPERCFTGSTGTVEVSAKINEPRTGGGSNFGQSKTTFEIFNIADNPLKAHKTQVTSGSQYQNTNEEICTEGLDKTICRVMNNEVIAITATEMEGSAVGSEGNISWTVNGQTYTCDEKISNDCNSTHNTNIIYIPIKGRDGDLITVTALSHGVNKDQNRQQQVTRVFRITEPSVAIVPQGNTVSRKVLGVYTDLDDNEFLDESANIFEITEGTTATLSADLYPKFLNDAQDTISYEWYINGTLYDTTKTIQYAPESDTVVSVRAQKHMSEDERWTLNQVYGAARSSTAPSSFTHTIELTTKQDTTLTQGVQGFFATVTTNAPEYIIFLLKITFALAVMLFIPSLVLGVGKQEN
jgi:hypothetical protein